MDNFSIEWWVWLLGGLGLMALEMLTPGGFFWLFLGCAAVVVGALSGLGMPGGFVLQGSLFVGLAAGAILLLRKPLLARFPTENPSRPVDAIPGETAIAMGAIPAGGYGQVELRGTAWRAHNVGAADIPAAGRCVVERLDGLTLLVKNQS
jgi:membrane protein implicated in regulation of membrane protease activity